MLEIVCFLFPALFSVFALERLLAKKLSSRNFLMVFVTNTLLINVVSLFVMFCISGAKVMPLSVQAGININYTLVYLTITCFLAIICVLVERFYFYRLRIGVDEKKSDLNAKNNASDKT